jgi:phenylalanyl-tRNA synthetase alpha chain
MEGRLHPLTHVYNDVVRIFGTMGFSIAIGPELEDEWHNFDALNVPESHPARDMQDTFWIQGEKGNVLRTHTSPVQIRYLETYGAPCAVIAPGKVFRNEATDATHEAQFFQVEGLLIGTDVTMAHLKGTLASFFKQFLGDAVEIRFRPSFFPFVEPGVEVDVLHNGKWLEVLGAGMVHPKVLRSAGINETLYRGFAFGFGLDRLMQLRYGVSDVRFSYQGDLRLNQL